MGNHQLRPEGLIGLKIIGPSGGIKVTHSIRGNRPIARIRNLDYTTTKVLGDLEYVSVFTFLVLH